MSAIAPLNHSQSEGPHQAIVVDGHRCRTNKAVDRYESALAPDALDYTYHAVSDIFYCPDVVCEKFRDTKGVHHFHLAHSRLLPSYPQHASTGRVSNRFAESCKPQSRHSTHNFDAVKPRSVFAFRHSYVRSNTYVHLQSVEDSFSTLTRGAYV